MLTGNQALAAAMELPDVVQTFIGHEHTTHGGERMWWGELCRILLQSIYADEGTFIRFVRNEPCVAWMMLRQVVDRCGDGRVSGESVW